MRRPQILLLLLIARCVSAEGAPDTTAPAPIPTPLLMQQQKGVCGNGSTTVLEYEASAPAHLPQPGKRLGHTRFVLRSRLANEVLFEKTMDEQWSCWGYSNALRAYILAGQWEKGPSIRLQSILYLSEAGLNRLRPSVFDKQEYWAVTSVLSPDSDVLAFIGGPANQTTASLYVMDFSQNKIQKLGKAPAPPPLPDPAAEGAVWGWDQSKTSYQELDKGILYFASPSVLKASYGADTARDRAKTRQIKSWIIR